MTTNEITHTAVGLHAIDCPKCDSDRSVFSRPSWNAEDMGASSCVTCESCGHEWSLHLAVVDSAATMPRAASIALLHRCEQFIAGFEGDELQDGLPDALLVDLRGALDGAALAKPASTAEADALCAELEAYCKAQSLPLMSADELSVSEHVNDTQSAWLRDFCARWDKLQGRDTGRPIVRPRHMIVGGNAYWAESLPGGLSFLMGAAVKVGGAVDWDSDYEVEHTACPNYDAILRDLTIG